MKLLARSLLLRTTLHTTQLALPYSPDCRIGNWSHAELSSWQVPNGTTATLLRGLGIVGRRRVNNRAEARVQRWACGRMLKRIHQKGQVRWRGRRAVARPPPAPGYRVGRSCFLRCVANASFAVCFSRCVSQSLCLSLKRRKPKKHLYMQATSD